jgi:N-acetylglutamate synthase-like GNAT family acetyltransferase
VAGSRTSAAQILEALSRHRSVILVGLNNKAIVACAHVEKDGNSSNIGMLAVNPILQGAGAGKLMLAEAEKYASSVFSSEKFVMVVASERTELETADLLKRSNLEKTAEIENTPFQSLA